MGFLKRMTNWSVRPRTLGLNTGRRAIVGRIGEHIALAEIFEAGRLDLAADVSGSIRCSRSVSRMAEPGDGGMIDDEIGAAGPEHGEDGAVELSRVGPAHELVGIIVIVLRGPDHVERLARGQHRSRLHLDPDIAVGGRRGDLAQGGDIAARHVGIVFGQTA